MHTLALPFNDLEAVRAAFAARPNEIACVIIEPIVGNAGTIPPAPGYLEGLRDITREHGALLILDEVMTGFRVYPRRSAAASTTSSPTSPPSARSSAAASPAEPSADAPTS